MLHPLMFLIISFIISIILMTIGSLLSLNFFQNREKGSPYECGFDPKGSARTPFSLRFFLLALIFLIFDVEVVLLFPLPLLVHGPHLTTTLVGSSIFLIILFLGLMHEWKEGSLNWAE